MSDSAQGAYTVKSETPTEQIKLDDRNDPPTNLVDAMAQTVADPIKREVGNTVAFSKGRDYDTTKVRVIPSMFKNASEDEKALYLNQGKGTGISISLQSLKDIIAWAETEK